MSAWGRKPRLTPRIFCHLELKIDLQFDQERYDRYGRTLASVTLADGRSVAGELAKAGLGIPLVVGGNDAYHAPVLDAFKVARDTQSGYFDPTIECTLPAQEAQLQQDVAVAEAVDEGSNAAQAAVAVATVLALYETHEATVRTIRAGKRFAVRAIQIAGAVALVAAYERQTESLDARHQEFGCSRPQAISG